MKQKHSAQTLLPLLTGLIKRDPESLRAEVLTVEFEILKKFRAAVTLQRKWRAFRDSKYPPNCSNTKKNTNNLFLREALSDKNVNGSYLESKVDSSSPLSASCVTDHLEISTNSTSNNNNIINNTVEPPPSKEADQHELLLYCSSSLLPYLQHSSSSNEPPTSSYSDNPSSNNWLLQLLLKHPSLQIRRCVLRLLLQPLVVALEEQNSLSNNNSTSISTTNTCPLTAPRISSSFCLDDSSTPNINNDNSEVNVLEKSIQSADELVEYRIRLMCLVVNLINQYLVMNNHHDAYHKLQTIEYGDSMIQLFAMLHYLVFCPPPGQAPETDNKNVSHNNKNKKSEECRNKTKKKGSSSPRKSPGKSPRSKGSPLKSCKPSSGPSVPEYKHSSLHMSFAACGGLSWAVAHLFRCAVHLRVSQRAHGEHNEFENECLQSKMVLLMDFVSQLLSSDERIVEQCIWASSSSTAKLNGVNMCMLSCIYMAVDTVKKGLSRFRSRGLERFANQLFQFIDIVGGSASNSEDSLSGSLFGRRAIGIRRQGEGLSFAEDLILGRYRAAAFEVVDAAMREDREVDEDDDDGDEVTVEGNEKGGESNEEDASEAIEESEGEEGHEEIILEKESDEEDEHDEVDHHDEEDDDEEKEGDEDDIDEEEEENDPHTEVITMDIEDEKSPEEEDHPLIGLGDFGEDHPSSATAMSLLQAHQFEDLAMSLGGEGIRIGSRAKPREAPKQSLEKESSVSKEMKKKKFIESCVQLIESQYIRPRKLKKAKVPSSLKREDTQELTILSMDSLNGVAQKMCHIINPPPKPLNLRIFLRRTPSQEEYFRGSLSKNPILLSSLTSAIANSEPLMSDLRRHIANDLQMADSAELIELLVGGKLIDMSLKVRVVQQVHWRKHVLNSNESGYSSDTSTSSLPPMVVTYRLAGLDGEATEDKIETLADENESGQVDPEEKFALTKIISKSGSRRTYQLLLKNIVLDVESKLKSLRRDMMNSRARKRTGKDVFLKGNASSSLILLRYCAKIRSNREILLGMRALSHLLGLLLKVLSAIDSEDSSSLMSERHVGGNSIVEVLQELIESLASDISSFSFDDSEVDLDSDSDQGTLQWLLQSLTESSLAPQLRKRVVDLLPYLTYGLESTSQMLANEFVSHVNFSELKDEYSESILMDTFIESAMSMPTVDVCNTLRSQLLKCGFVFKVVSFVLNEAPRLPPSWVPALFSKTDMEGLGESEKENLEKLWRRYFDLPGISKAIKMLTGLSKSHLPVQKFLMKEDRLLKVLHYIESVSDTGEKDLGILAETFLDTLKESTDTLVQAAVNELRKSTTLRKKELAEERRNKALAGMRNALPIPTKSETNSATEKNLNQKEAPKPTVMPAWMAEMEAMEDEEGLSCCVCQEGKVYQPSELLGLYIYAKKVTIPHLKMGSRMNLDGTNLYANFPQKLPPRLVGSLFESELNKPVKTVATSVRLLSSSIPPSGSRATCYITTVTAGNAIHQSCHIRAKQADRNNPKAPKNEWDGASLRNNRVACNAIFPLVTISKGSEVPLIAVESALSSHQNTLSNLMGARPKLMVWVILHDVRLLMLRISHEEALNNDCGGGSLLSNTQMLFHLLMMADMFTTNTELEAPTTAKQIKFLGPAFVSGIELITDVNSLFTDFKKKKDFMIGLIESAPMACISCILFNNISSANSEEDDATLIACLPSLRGFWKKYRVYFFRGLVAFAGRCKTLGVEGSGCVSSGRRGRSSSIGEWEVEESSNKSLSPEKKSGIKRKNEFTLEDNSKFLKPAISFFLLCDALSQEFIIDKIDDDALTASERVANVIESFRKKQSLAELVSLANVSLDDSKIVDDFNIGLDIM